MARRTHYDAFLAIAAEHGFSAYEASKLDGAAEAAAKDKAEAAQRFSSKSTADHLETFLRHQVANGLPLYFTDQETMLAAIAAPEYARSQEYRDAVAQIIEKSPSELIGVSGYMKDNLGQTVKIGRNGLSEEATVNSMLNNAYDQMLEEKLAAIPSTTAEGRYLRLQLATAPECAEYRARHEARTVSPEQRARQELLDMKASGEPLRVQAGAGDYITTDNSGVAHKANEKDIDYDRPGFYKSGERAPIGDANDGGRKVE